MCQQFAGRTIRPFPPSAPWRLASWRATRFTGSGGPALVLSLAGRLAIDLDRIRKPLSSSLRLSAKPRRLFGIAERPRLPSVVCVVRSTGVRHTAKPSSLPGCERRFTLSGLFCSHYPGRALFRSPRRERCGQVSQIVKEREAFASLLCLYNSNRLTDCKPFNAKWQKFFSDLP